MKLIRNRALELSEEKKETDEIAELLGLSRRRVQKILQEERGSVRTRKATEERVALFRSDPHAYMKARFTQSNAFGRALLKTCANDVENKPKQGLTFVEPALQLFDRIRKTRLVDTTARRAQCLYVQSQGIEARAYALMKQFRTAEHKLEQAIREASGCIECEAEELWRFGLLYLGWKRWPEAYSSIAGAMERYRSFSGAGHDLLGNGIANCMLVKTALLYHTVSPEAGASEARNALETLTGRESPLLFEQLVCALAKCLLPSQDPLEIERSEKLLDWCFDRHGARTSRPVARIFIYMLKGQLFAVKGKREEAIETLTLALEAAQRCERENEIGLIVADLGLLDPDPWKIRAHIEEFCDWDADGELILPPWCRNIEGEIRRLYDLALTTKHTINDDVLVALREAAGGDARMPSFMMPSLSSGAGAPLSL